MWCAVTSPSSKRDGIFGFHTGTIARKRINFDSQAAENRSRRLEHERDRAVAFCMVVRRQFMRLADDSEEDHHEGHTSEIEDGDDDAMIGDD